MNTDIQITSTTGPDETTARLAELSQQLLQKVDERVAPTGIFHWSPLQPYAIAKFDGSDAAPPLRQQLFGDLYDELVRGVLPSARALPALEALEANAARHRDGGVVPIALVEQRYTTARRRYVAAVVRHAKDGVPFDVPAGAPTPEQLHEAVEHRQAFLAAPLLKQEFLGFAPVAPKHYGLAVRFKLASDCFLWSTGAPPAAFEVDLDDGQGWRKSALDAELATVYATEGRRQVWIRALADGRTMLASFELEVGAVAAPAPNRTLSLKSTLPPRDGVTPTGQAFVFYGTGNASLTAPVLVAEGFPGGYSLDFLWEKLNQQNLASDLLAAGKDLVIIGFKQGTFYMDANAGVVIDAIGQCAQEMTAHGKTPSLIVGGASMGGVVARYALAYMEANKLPHHTSKYFSIDSPHNGAFVPVSAQIFANYLAPYNSNVKKVQDLLQSSASQQLLLLWLTPDNKTCSAGPKRAAFNAQLKAAGWYPKQPAKHAVADGSGFGFAHPDMDGAQALYWSQACAGADLYTAPGGAEDDRRLLARMAYKETRWQYFYATGGLLPSQESAPGGLSPAYDGIAQALKDAGENATVKIGATCFIPVISALGMDDLDPYDNAALRTSVYALYDSPKRGGTWLDSYTFPLFRNLQHIDIDADLAGWIGATLQGKTLFAVNDEGKVFSLPDGELVETAHAALDVGLNPDATLWVLSRDGKTLSWRGRGENAWHDVASPVAAVHLAGRPNIDGALVGDAGGAMYLVKRDGTATPYATGHTARAFSFNRLATVWIAGGEERAGGYALSWYVGTSFDHVWHTLPAPAAAVAVAVLPNGGAMTVDSHGDVRLYRQDGTHQDYPGVKARQVAAAGDGTVWVLSDRARPGGFAPCRLDWSTGTWHELPGAAAAVRLAAL